MGSTTASMAHFSSSLEKAGRRVTIETDQFRQLLLQRRDELLAVAEEGHSASATVELDQSKVGRLSRMDALQAQAMSQEAVRRRELALQQIAAALRRIDNGDYGFCVVCGEPIAEARLRYNPATSMCIGCAEHSA